MMLRLTLSTWCALQGMRGGGWAGPGLKITFCTHSLALFSCISLVLSSCKSLHILFQEKKIKTQTKYSLWEFKPSPRSEHVFASFPGVCLRWRVEEQCQGSQNLAMPMSSCFFATWLEVSSSFTESNKTYGLAGQSWNILDGCFASQNNRIVSVKWEISGFLFVFKHYILFQMKPWIDRDYSLTTLTCLFLGVLVHMTLAI